MLWSQAGMGPTSTSAALGPKASDSLHWVLETSEDRARSPPHLTRLAKHKARPAVAAKSLSTGAARAQLGRPHRRLLSVPSLLSPPLAPAQVFLEPAQKEKQPRKGQGPTYGHTLRTPPPGLDPSWSCLNDQQTPEFCIPHTHRYRPGHQET